MSAIHGFARYITTGNLIAARQCYCGEKFDSDGALNNHVRAANEGAGHMVEEVDSDPFDALLRLAVDLHSERYRYQKVDAEDVLAFLNWLRDRKDRP